MAFYVYIIQSKADSSYYKGFTENPVQRLEFHNNGESNYTSNKLSWVFVYAEELPTKKDALVRERALKKYSHAQIEKLISSPKNIIESFG